MPACEAKGAFRERALAARLAVSEQARAEAGVLAGKRLVALLEPLGLLGRPITVLAYATHGHEFPAATVVGAIASALGSERLRTVYPRVSGPTSLTLHECSADRLVAGYREILEPSGDLPTVDPSEVDVVLVPGVAFDERAMRLGYGKGFYDRALGSMTRALKVGLSFDETLFTSIPCEPHDFPLDAVITPTRTVKPAAQ